MKTISLRVRDLRDRSIPLWAIILLGYLRTKAGEKRSTEASVDHLRKKLNMNAAQQGNSLRQLQLAGLITVESVRGPAGFRRVIFTKAKSPSHSSAARSTTPKSTTSSTRGKSQPSKRGSSR